MGGGAVSTVRLRFDIQMGEGSRHPEPRTVSARHRRHACPCRQPVWGASCGASCVQQTSSPARSRKESPAGCHGMLKFHYKRLTYAGTSRPTYLPAPDSYDTVVQVGRCGAIPVLVCSRDVDSNSMLLSTEKITERAYLLFYFIWTACADPARHTTIISRHKQRLGDIDR